MAWNIFEDRPLAGKIGLIGLIVAGLMIPLSMLRGLIAERSQMRTQAVATVAKGWGGSLSAGGPIIRVPFDVERKSRTGEISIESHQLYILADDLKVQATLEHAATRRVGIYGVPVYLVHINVNAGFRMSEVLAAAETGPYANMTLHWKEARIRLPLSDVRSVREIGSAAVGQHPLMFGPALANGIPGVEAKIDLSEFLQQESLPFSAQLILAGSESLNFLPTAAKSTLELQSNWPDPQFQGAFLPSQYHVDSHGFQAQWQVLALNRAFAQSWVDTQVDAAKLASAEYGVGLFQSVDVYQRSERAVKYALVFIALTFLSFLAWEALAQIAVHPVQYGLVGLALSTFYLLLIALAEHLPFWLSYWLGAAALAGLLGFYISGALNSVRSGAIVALMMSFVYGLLFMLVLSESYSLLIGAIALFAVLAAVMIATRRLRWGRQDPDRIV
jgi:inner membrane protein